MTTLHNTLIPENLARMDDISASWLAGEIAFQAAYVTVWLAESNPIISVDFNLITIREALMHLTNICDVDIVIDDKNRTITITDRGLHDWEITRRRAFGDDWG